MKKSSKIALGVMSFALAAPMMGIVANAAEGTGTTPVTYDTSKNIPDPDNPTYPEWAVVIPKAIVFTDETNGREANADITLTTKSGASLPTGNDFVEVKVASKNGFKLTYSGEDMPYTMEYDGGTGFTGTLNTGTTATKIGELQDGKVKITATAKLSGTATILGSHEDTLTYTVGKITKP